MKHPIKIQDLPIGTICDNSHGAIYIVTGINECKILASKYTHERNAILPIHDKEYLPKGSKILSPEEVDLLKLELL